MISAIFGDGTYISTFSFLNHLSVLVLRTSIVGAKKMIKVCVLIYSRFYIQNGEGTSTSSLLLIFVYAKFH